jgi:tRNA U34 5-carboxymethylaminomethyl modifying enzyme MnmG/GidA
VRELDALGGLMARVTDRTSIQFRHLNTRKGLAVRSSRAQVDVDRYPAEMAAALDAIPGLTVVEAEVAGVETRGGRVSGVVLGDGSRIEAPRVVLTTGTFLAGTLFRGEERAPGGRIGDPAAERLSRSLADLGLRLGIADSRWRPSAIASSGRSWYGGCWPPPTTRHAWCRSSASVSSPRCGRNRWVRRGGQCPSPRRTSVP